MTQQTHNTVFISYRRTVSVYLARSIYMDLKEHGYDVFMDTKNIDSGPFGAVILNQIEARAHFLLICTPGTFERVNEPNDWLRREIEHAMAHNRNIVPITSDFQFERKINTLLTGKLATLPEYNALEVPHVYFEAAMERLRIQFLKPPREIKIAKTSTAEAEMVAERKQEVERQPVEQPPIKPLTVEQPPIRALTADELVTRAGVHYDRGNITGALADYTEAIRLNQKHDKAHYQRGFVQMQKGNYGAALADFERYVDLTSSAPDPTWMRRARGYISDLKHKLGRR